MDRKGNKKRKSSGQLTPSKKPFVSSLYDGGNTDRVDNLLDKQYESKIRPFIDLIDSLRAVGVEEDLALPAIVVIGDQSSGKSSVLEALSGVCLPRGSGIVTRCPLELKLKKNTGNTDWAATISYRNYTETFCSASSVEQEITKAQNIMAGTNNGISHELITLEIVSPTVPDLTLIDLPGITRIALPNQPKDIPHQIKAMIKKFITRPETINLAVVPSNVDVVTTEALEMAREVDPCGDRTIGILTKPDLVDRGSEEQVVNTVQNKVYNLKKGYMIVKCRGQLEVQANISLQDALENEKIFFNNHQHFRGLLEAGRATIPNLAEKLTDELVTHIARTLPNIKIQIKTKLRDAEDKLEKIGRGLPDSEDERVQYLIKIITNFTNAIMLIVNGELDGEKEDLKLFKTLREKFDDWDKQIKLSRTQFVQELEKNPEIYENQYRGRELAGFINYRRFEAILHNQILTLQAPAMRILCDARGLVQRCFIHEASKCFDRFKNLQASAEDKIVDISRAQEHEAESNIKLQFQMEGIIYCQDTIYCTALSEARREGGDVRGRTPPQEQSHPSPEDLACHIETYLKETTTRLSNQIPLIIQHYILKEYAVKLHSQMVLLIQNQQCAHLLEETNDLAQQRQALKNQIQRLRLAEERLTKFSAQSYCTNENAN